jgi:hypothetical protein
MTRHPIMAVLALAVVVGSLCFSPAPAEAAARVSVSSAAGSARASGTGATTLTLRGSGFQSIPKAMGGIYVFFGTVDDPGGGSWRPSRGGTSGVDFRYLPDSETRNNQGRQRFVSFPGSQTEDAANGGVVAADGSWGTTLNVPGPVIDVVGRSGTTERVDCRKQACGVITIGAHGIKNANNETFTRVTFAAPSGTTSSTPGRSTNGSGTAPGTGTAPSTEGASPGGGTGTPGSGTAGVGELALGVDQSSAVAGRVMSFTARGFAPTEQVSLVLDDGRAGIGPLVAGSRGEVAGVLQLPRDLRIGTHSLQASGAASGLRVHTTFAVSAPADEVAASPAPSDSATPGQTPPWAWMALAVAGAAVLLVVFAGVIGRRAGRRAARLAGSDRPGLTPTELDALLSEARRQGFREVSER